jgi:hypothetical protein
MHFARSFLALAVVAVTAVQAAPGLSTSLTKRCGSNIMCASLAVLIFGHRVRL